MDINLRLIQQESIQDRENYFALQKSVALFPDKKIDNKEVWEDTSWKEQFENKNRICYVIETMPENSYCGECAVKDISVNIPEIEIELMKEYQHQGIGYKAIIMLLSKLAKEYRKQEFYAKIEPDNYASQFLFEKLRGIPAGIVKDFQISDERVERFTETHRYLLDERIRNIAEKFGVEADLLLTHLLVYKLNSDDLQEDNIDRTAVANQREYMECLRTLSKEKYKDVVMECLEDLEEIKNFGEAKEKITAKLAEMESKLLGRMKLIRTANLDEIGVWQGEIQM